jgi:lipopolysaccharide/colanic/teichoic acid biosynthesis glycosyltransferase
MVPDAEKKGLQLTTAEDIRVTRPGKFLRKYKLDELPQLINVLKGEMSLVGPRPEVPRYVEHYPDSMRKIIFSVPPGITDLASIEFKDENTLLQESRNPEETYIREILPIKLEYYTEYVRNRSVKGDLKIIIKTIKSLLC